jgi:hypothetical protein
MANDKVKAQLAQLTALDDDTAHIVAVALNADAEIRRISGSTTLWTTIDVQRVAKMLVEHAGASAPSPDIEIGIERLVRTLPGREEK